MIVQYVKLHPNAIPPRQAYDDDAGWDLFALEHTAIAAVLGPRLTWVRTGIALALPTGYYGRIVGRSSAATKGYHVIEGTMDAGYRGEQLVRVCPLWQPDRRDGPGGVVLAGESLAQLVVSKVEPVEFVEIDELPPSARGTNGFGSSG